MSDFQGGLSEQVEEVVEPTETQAKVEQLNEVLDAADEAFDHVLGPAPRASHDINP